MAKRNKELLYDVAIAIVILIAVFIAFLHFDVFDLWYQYTRAHEDWELDEIFAFGLAILFAGTVLSFRHIFLLRRLFKEVDVANKEILYYEEEKERRNRLSSLETIAGGLAHEINNALQPILGLGDIVLRGLKESGDEKHTKYMYSILYGAQHARGIVENVLLFAREKSIRIETADAFDVLSDAIKYSTETLSGSSRFVVSGLEQLKSSNANQRLYLECNRTALYQIFYNLLKNSAKASGVQGEVQILLERADMPEAKGQRPALSIKISDNGCGMTSDVMQKIFDPFFTTKDVSEGTGLGLPTVYSLLEQHNAKIFVESEIHVGSVFTMYFPLIIKAKEGE